MKGDGLGANLFADAEEIANPAWPDERHDDRDQDQERQDGQLPVHGAGAAGRAGRGAGFGG